MANDIIIDAGTEQTRVAMLEDGELVELYMELNGRQNLVGNIYRGKVSSVLPGMQAAFIDIGLEKNAFLYVADAIPQKEYSDEDRDEKTDPGECRIVDLLKPGQEITVQVIKEAMGTKGPRVTTHITIPGRYLVLLPNADYIGISRRMENEEERSRLRQIAESLKPEGMGLILRTASEGMEEDDLSQDINFLSKLWERIKKGEKSGAVPRCLHRDENLVYRTVRDHFTPAVRKLVINSREQFERVLELVELMSPVMKLKVEMYSRDYEPFEFYNIEPKIRRALARKVWLKSGGYLVIDNTEALTVIDVNTGKYTGSSNLEDTVLKTNIEAAGEIAKQLRLRDIGGIIVIDFIDMHEQQHQQQILETLRRELRKDRTKAVVVGMTGLGLIEMTRKKVRQGLSAVMSEECPYCEGTGRIARQDRCRDQDDMNLSHRGTKDVDTDTLVC